MSVMLGTRKSKNKILNLLVCSTFLFVALLTFVLARIGTFIRNCIVDWLYLFSLLINLNLFYSIRTEWLDNECLFVSKDFKVIIIY